MLLTSVKQLTWQSQSLSDAQRNSPAATEQDCLISETFLLSFPIFLSEGEKRSELCLRPSLRLNGDASLGPSESSVG